MSRQLLVWTDLETTGIDEYIGVPLEVAIVVTDIEMNELGSFESVIMPPPELDVASMMDPFVSHMHANNGLLTQIAVTDPETNIETVEHAMVEFLYAIGNLQTSEVDFVIAGSTIHFDKKWIRTHFPQVENMLHYRQLDVSTYKVGFPEIFGSSTSAEHRAMADIRASMEYHIKMREIVAAGIAALA